MNSIIDETYTRLGGDMTAGILQHVFSRTEGNKVTVLDTPGLWGKSPADNGYWLPSLTVSANCRKLLQEIESVVGSARSFVDITVLWHTASKTSGFPDLLFLQALQRGFAQIAASGARPLIRILIGVPFGPIVSVQDLANWVSTLLPGDTDLTVHIATNHTTALGSWNHAKIIAADGKSAIVGGHNLWSSAYMVFAPVHDVSVRVDGPGAITAHAFANWLWTKPFDCILWHKRQFKNGVRPGPVTLPAPQPAGSTRLLAVGRLGEGIGATTNKVSDASVYARVTAILRAESQIRLSQQSLGFQLAPSDITDITSFDLPTMAALTKAMLTGVKVSIVLSNDGAQDASGDPYSSTKVAQTMKYFILFMALEMQRNTLPPKDAGPDKYYELGVTDFMVGILPPPFERAVTFLNSQLFLTTLQFSAQGGNWHYQNERGSKDVIPGNHAKVYIIDDTNYYVGSDNMYRSGSKAGLQEFGYLLEGQAETRDFIASYWDNLWRYSQNRRVLARWPIL